MHQQSGWTATSSRIIDAPTSAIPTIFMPDAFPGTPSQFILAWDRHQMCWLAYPVARLGTWSLSLSKIFFESMQSLVSVVTLTSCCLGIRMTCHRAGILCENLTASTKLEIHDVLQHRQSRTKPHKIWWSLAMWFLKADSQTDIVIAILHTPPWNEVTMTPVILMVLLDWKFLIAVWFYLLNVKACFQSDLLCEKHVYCLTVLMLLCD